MALELLLRMTMLSQQGYQRNLLKSSHYCLVHFCQLEWRMIVDLPLVCPPHMCQDQQTMALTLYLQQTVVLMIQLRDLPRRILHHCHL